MWARRKIEVSKLTGQGLNVSSLARVCFNIWTCHMRHECADFPWQSGPGGALLFLSRLMSRHLCGQARLSLEQLAVCVKWPNVYEARVCQVGVEWHRPWPGPYKSELTLSSSELIKSQKRWLMFAWTLSALFLRGSFLSVTSSWVFFSSSLYPICLSCGFQGHNYPLCLNHVDFDGHPRPELQSISFVEDARQ